MTTDYELLREQIEARAYQLWQERDASGGNPDEDWFQAERELLTPEAFPGKEQGGIANEQA